MVFPLIRPILLLQIVTTLFPTEVIIVAKLFCKNIQIRRAIALNLIKMQQSKEKYIYNKKMNIILYFLQDKLDAA